MSPDSSTKTISNKKKMSKINNGEPLTGVREHDDTQSNGTAFTGVPDDVSIAQIRQLNENLKDELTVVISQMEFQVNKIQEKRQLKMAQEMQTLAALDAKQNKLFKGQKNFVALKKEVNGMYAVLEENYDDT